MKDLIDKLKNTANIMMQLGDLQKANTCFEAVKVLEQINKSADEFDVSLAESMFTKHELAKMYVAKIKEIEKLKAQDKGACPWCGQLLR